nr:MAG TPA: hypothetical protein [Bacteriophage sp.]
MIVCSDTSYITYLDITIKYSGQKYLSSCRGLFCFSHKKG